MSGREKKNETITQLTLRKRFKTRDTILHNLNKSTLNIFIVITYFKVEH